MKPRVKLYVPREESFPTPLKYIDVTRNTDTSLDVMLEKNIDDCWRLLEIENCHIHGQVSQDSLSDKKTNGLQARHFVARDLERYPMRGNAMRSKSGLTRKRS